MNDKETLTPWEPLEGFTYNYYIHSVCSDSNGLKIVLADLSDEKRSVMITFPEGVVTCRMTDDLIGRNLFRAEGEPDKDVSYVCCVLFKVTNSQYLKWAAQKIDNNEYLKLIHFVVGTVDWTLEILNNTEPYIEFFDAP